ncbi:MAG TPA: SUMF1/EgtB/PvdO family nonheme iron enzyme, partial [Vicinamibacteria bacterium]|nr:SUMF1/EgtB/PvdO family nonheme iron enzyme [Vicinamibacteria bacterium]
MKILDFGLAKALGDEARGDSALPTYTRATAAGTILGTVHYMSPEQASAGAVDHRSDQFSLGIVLYELLSGQRPFEGSTAATVISSILRDPAPPVRSLRPEVSEELASNLHRCLEKDRGARFPSVAELRRALLANLEISSPRRRRFAVRRHWREAAVAALLVAAGLAWIQVRSLRDRALRSEAVREITRLTDVGDLSEAYRLAAGASRRFPGDPGIREVRERITLPLPVNTNPPGADIFIKSYAEPDAPWEPLGRTPIEDVGIPYALMRWKIEKEGFETIEAAPFGTGSLTALAVGISLEPLGSRPEGMVPVPAGLFEGAVGIEIGDDFPAIEIGAYWLDRFEVRNREFKAFVDAGGYENEEFWPEVFLVDGREIPRREGIASFRDATGRTAPATWQLGTFPIGTEDLPVAGVSWYEAAAYCAFAGKSLPTLYHWFRAAEQAQVSDILHVSNFGSGGPAAVGSYAGLGPFGTYDMAGNVKEWCFNENDEGSRYVLGGSAGEPVYMYSHLVAEDPLVRSSSHGIRCARYLEPPSEALLGPVVRSWNFSERSPANDDVFEAYLGLYEYDRVALNGSIDSLDEGSPHWRLQTVSYDAAYDGERVTTLLFLPRNATPPYQAVVWFPGNDVFMSRSRERLASSYLFDFIPQSGRVLVYPIYKGMYERFLPFSRAPNEFRDRMVYWSKDLCRTLDYLERREDISREKIAYYGFSAGALYGPIFSAIDSRFRASVLLAGGLHPIMTKRPETDLVSFAPRS